MKERITFVRATDDEFDPKQLHLGNGTLSVRSLTAVREDQLTFSLYELPQEVAIGLLSKSTTYNC